MIKCVRKIRQRLISENKFGKYLLYTIRATILVVIGISSTTAVKTTHYKPLLQDLDTIPELIHAEIKK